MKLGMVGLPNVGKSTLFNAITNAGAQSANYPFCTIEPNIGMVSVPDERLDKLAEMYDPDKFTPATIELTMTTSHMMTAALTRQEILRQLTLNLYFPTWICSQEGLKTEKKQ